MTPRALPPFEPARPRTPRTPTDADRLAAVEAAVARFQHHDPVNSLAEIERALHPRTN